jgi:hypothetical protein
MNPFHFLTLLFYIIVTLTTSCSSSDSTEENTSQQRYEQREFIYRLHNDTFGKVPPGVAQTPEPYPWDKNHVGNHLKITKDFFRCRGSNLNPVHIVQEKGEQVRYYDCGGSEKHSLQLRNQKEFVYPILIDLLNYIQAKTEKRVVITSGHRCPDHNTYVDASESNRFSKHMVGAEVSFYVQGQENNPEAIVRLIQNYYKETAKYENKKEYIEFQRYQKGDTDVSTQPWMNKEVFIKLYKTKEGRNFDNRHPYPYLSIQVRYDFDTREKIIYTWDKGNNNFMRF